MGPYSTFGSLVSKLREWLSSALNAEKCEEAAAIPSGDEQEQLYSLVQQHHGRVRQQTLIEETGWHPTKVSEHLQEMEENRCVVRVLTGREKIIVLPEQLPADANVE